MSEPAIGIDLGTTYSCVAVYKNGKVEIIPNEHGNRITPSCVAFTDMERLIGDTAKEQDYRNPTNTIFDAKRLIGRKFDDPIVQNDMKDWPFEVINEGGDPKIRVKYRNKHISFYPEEVSAMILTKMKHIAQDYLGTPVRHAVITVPAYFNNLQRQSTKDAGAIAGLNILRIINEPTAGALAYGYGKDDSSETNVLIYDLGGGTFDVSILSIESGIFEVRATTGDTHLGGEDFDSRMVIHFIKEFERKHKMNLMTDKQALRRLRTACEQAKRTLSSSETAYINLQLLHNNIDFNSSMTRAYFEALNEDLFKATIEMVEHALKDAEMSKTDIHEVVLIGGSTRIPMVQKLLHNFFDGKHLNKSVNADEAVAYGAALHAGLLESDTLNTGNDIVLVDVTPLSLGIGEETGTMSVIVERNTPIPTKKERNYYTVKDNQSGMIFSIYEGERKIAKDNNLLGKFVLADIKKGPRGSTKVDVTFEIDQNGILDVTAIENNASNVESIRIANSNRHSKEEVEKMIKNAERFRKEDEEELERIRARNDLDYYCYNLKKRLEEKEIVAVISLKSRKEIMKKCDKCISWLDVNPFATKEEYENKLKKMHKVCEVIANYL